MTSSDSSLLYRRTTQPPSNSSIRNTGVTSFPLATKLFGLLAASFLALCFGCGGSEVGTDTCIPYTVMDCPEDTSGCFDDGCGGILNCGGCDDIDVPIPDAGPGPGPDVPVCVRKTCENTNSCGENIDDGCGGILTCGCTAPNSCIEGTCQCTPLSCQDQGNPQGEIYDGCGNFIRCNGSGNTTETIRIATGNLTSTGSMTLSNGTTEEFRESWDLGHGKRIMQGIKPKIALLQEMKTLFYEKNRTNYWRNSDEAFRDFVSKTFGDRFYSYRENRVGKNMGKPNAIVSYYPIKAAGEFESSLENIRDRSHTWARIDIPGDRDLWVVSVHITTGTNSEFGSTKEQQTKDIRGLIEDLRALNIPKNDYLVIGGDFNTTTRTGGCMSSLSSSGLVYVDTESDCPIDQRGNGDTNAHRNSPYDQVLVSNNLRAFQVAPKIGNLSGLQKRGFVVDTRKFSSSTIQEIAPAKTSDSDAEDMQHMAVLKDFAVPR